MKIRFIDRKKFVKRRWSEQGLYSPSFEHDSCGFGFVANVNGTPSRDIVEKGLELNCKIEHRGAVGADPETGDGAGLLAQIPHAFFQKVCQEQNIKLPARGKYGIGWFFLPQNPETRAQVIKIAEETLDSAGLTLLGWRKVPSVEAVLGETAKLLLPYFAQCFVSPKNGEIDDYAFEQKLYLVRCIIDRTVDKNLNLTADEYHVPSFSCRTIIYKGMFLAEQLKAFYPDLQDSHFISAIAMIHMRFSTNTFPSWNLAQPFRYIAHNGEINTLRGNQNWMKARQAIMESDYFGADIKRMLPLVLEGQSDSACFDLVLELLYMSGRSLQHAMMMMIPEAWSKAAGMDPKLKAFYEYHAMIMEPWDGPVALAFTDGRYVGATLDRNGLRPARYTIFKDGTVFMASEAVTTDIPNAQIVEQGKLEPGKMFLLDTREGRIFSDTEIKRAVSTRQPYDAWVRDNVINLSDLADGAPTEPAPYSPAALLNEQRFFGYTRESVFNIIKPMVESSQEPTGSMGNDAALAVLSAKSPRFSRYFKQLFAQITNPAIDPIREELVMELTSYVGPTGNLLKEDPAHARKLKLNHPVISNAVMAKLKAVTGAQRAVTLSLLFPADSKGGMRNHISKICTEAEAAITKDDVNLIILSDRATNAEKAAVPGLLALAGLHHHLIRKGLRTKVGLIIETGDAFEVFDFALLCGYGANAINPYLAYASIRDLYDRDFLNNVESFEAAEANYLKAIHKGLFKIFSKMGISTLLSYCGAQLFEIIGLNTEVVQNYFTATPSQVEGADLEMLEAELLQRHKEAYGDAAADKWLGVGGLLHYRSTGEKHLWTPLSISKLQQATRENDYAIYKQYSDLINKQGENKVTLRSLFRLNADRRELAVDAVEPETEIVQRFSTGAMSYGSISWEAHTNLAIAMNRINAKSNTGEGGEDASRYEVMENGDSMRSAIKQVASGRFGVTSNYLVNADQIQIKIAQGAKPGEGGQIPGIKVNDVIAKTRYSTAGVTLISPPPHHDIYSIEDIKQLIFDLKNANPLARISVKLASEVGVGTIAAGVAKAHADHILIAGHDGGTGASPVSSIHHAGTPWEFGLSETHQTLVINGLRDRVTLAVDGQLKTGRDVVIAAIMGAEEFGFSTTALVTQGCVMMRKCHLNTCPVGVATQDEKLRAVFSGKPEYLVNYMLFVAAEVREILAQLGYGKLTDIVGQTQLLKQVNSTPQTKASSLNFDKLFYKPDSAFETDLYNTKPQNHGIDLQIDNQFIKQATPAFENKNGAVIDINAEINNRHRAVGTLLSYEITRRYGEAGLSDKAVSLHLKGTAGQSFGAFAVKGVNIALTGIANDYVGKGLSGGRIIIKAPDDVKYNPAENFLAGNVCLYGATSGEFYAAGKVGERFAIRNSGAKAVVEGLGNHGCEYMTGGIVVVIGPIGVNFAAGMSGGVAVVWDKDHRLERMANLEMARLLDLNATEYAPEVHTLIQNHQKYTLSERAQYLLANWEAESKNFKLLIPTEYERALKKATSQKVLQEVSHG